MKNFWSFLRWSFSIAAYLYATAVFLWFCLHLFWGDRWGWLFLLNTGALYLVLWVPLWGIRPLFTKKRRDLILYTGLLAIFITRFGSLLTPNLNATPSQNQLTVMTTNLLGSNPHMQAIEQALLASDADIIGIQELSPRMAETIRSKLLDEYPYQLLDPKAGVTGMGIISRYPIELQPLPWGDQFWVGTPQLVQVDIGNTAVYIINFHAIPPVGDPLPDPRVIRIRETQARFLAEFSENSPQPVILLGDLNATDQSQAYAILKHSLQDSWHEGGTGLGNTWPGQQPSKAGSFTIPNWLVRIDHIFVSNDLRVIEAQVGPWDGGADHRPVKVTLALPIIEQAHSE